MVIAGDEPRGVMWIGADEVAGGGPAIRSMNPRTRIPLEPVYRYGVADEVKRAASLAEKAFDEFRATSAEQRAVFLEIIASGIDTAAPELIERAHLETALNHTRLQGEVTRTSNQLRLFAQELRSGLWQGVRIDGARPDETPQRPELRQRRVPLGPVAVFGASNFPFAYSVAGGDTASALAAGCPVVVKAHDAHLGTSELVARIVRAAVEECALPEGTFSVLVGDGPDLGIRLVVDPRIQAVGFTGSRSGGLALVKAAAGRDQPIPVFAEMSSVNPVVLLPGALDAGAQALAAAFVESLTLGAGQYCTNPGLVLGIDGPGLDAFVETAARMVAADGGAVMLSPNIGDAYRSACERTASGDGVTELARGKSADANASAAALYTVSGVDFVANPGLRSEMFGAASLVVRCRDAADIDAVLHSLDGQLTASLHVSMPNDRELAAAILPVLERLAGRIVFNGWPVGAAVGHGIVHGGPFPATSDSRTSSVGSLAIDRFLRPVAYQNVPSELLPDVLRDDNTEHVWRRIDGQLEPPASEPGRPVSSHLEVVR
ncbi:MAG: aldehyde dehydrogenase (NADP(+)) [Mycobacterium sp.]